MVPLSVYKVDIADLWRDGKTVCVTVSLEVRRKDLCGVMDRSNALALARHIPKLPSKLGAFIMIGKGEVGFIHERVIAFFTKPKQCRFENGLPDELCHYKWGQRIPGGHCMADPVIVARSARQLVRLAAHDRLRRIYLPIPGVGAGRLDVEDIEEALDVLADSPVVKLISNRDIDDPRVRMCELEDE